MHARRIRKKRHVGVSNQPAASDPNIFIASIIICEHDSIQQRFRPGKTVLSNGFPTPQRRVIQPPFLRYRWRGTQPTLFLSKTIDELRRHVRGKHAVLAVWLAGTVNDIAKKKVGS
jgi:hypothetical protein